MKKKRKITNLADLPPPTGAEKLKQLWENAAKRTKPMDAAATDLLLYDQIGPDFWSGGGLTHQFVSDWLAKLDAKTEAITVRINSPGGDVFEGVGIYNALFNWQLAGEGRTINVKIDALAASIASVIAMVGDHIEIGGNAMMMIHRASTVTWGNAGDHMASATVLDQIDQIIVDTYESRTGQATEDIKGWLAAETYMTADEAIDRGFADKKAPLKGMPAKAEDILISGAMRGEWPGIPQGELIPAEDESGARLAAARLHLAQMRQAAVSAQSASHLKQ